MRIVELCGKGHCPVIKIADDRVEIGEEGNLCVLSKDEWETLKQKILIHSPPDYAASPDPIRSILARP